LLSSGGVIMLNSHLLLPWAPERGAGRPRSPLDFEIFRK